MEELTARQSALQTRVTTSANRLQRGITHNSSQEMLDIYYRELEEAFLESQSFIDANCGDFTNAMKKIFSKARISYEQSIVCKTEKHLQTLCDKLDLVLAKVANEEDPLMLEVRIRRVQKVTCEIVDLK